MLKILRQWWGEVRDCGEAEDVVVVLIILANFAWLGLRSDVGTPVGVLAGQVAAWACLGVAAYAGYRLVLCGRAR